MTARHRVQAALATALAAATVGLLAQGLDLRPGEWEYVVTMGGPFTVPPSLPATAREQALAAMQRPRTVRDCLTAKEIADARIGRIDDDDGACTVARQRVAATTMDFTRVCTGDAPRTEVVHIELSGRERLRMTASRTGPGPATVTIAARWLHDTCTPNH